MAKKEVVEEVVESEVPTQMCANCDCEKPVTEMMTNAGICKQCAGYTDGS